MAAAKTLGGRGVGPAVVVKGWGRGQEVVQMEFWRGGSVSCWGGLVGCVGGKGEGEGVGRR